MSRVLQQSRVFQERGMKLAIHSQEVEQKKLTRISATVECVHGGILPTVPLYSDSGETPPTVTILRSVLQSIVCGAQWWLVLHFLGGGSKQTAALGSTLTSSMITSLASRQKQ